MGEVDNGEVTPGAPHQPHVLKHIRGLAVKFLSLNNPARLLLKV